MLLLRMIGPPIAACIALTADPAAASEQRLSYTVQMSPYGTIGTYQSARQTDGNIITITTEARIKVSLAGIVLHRLEISRVERQNANRLIYFHGITVENGNSVEIDGKAVGEDFIITSPSGMTTAPGTIRTLDPWSAGAPGTNIVFMPDTGVITGVHTTGGQQTTLTMGGTSVQVRRYKISTTDGREQYEVWIDEQRIPVMFNITDNDGTTTFTLVR